MGRYDAETTMSGSAFQILAAATGKARLPYVEYRLPKSIRCT